MIPAPDPIGTDIILGWSILVAFGAWLSTVSWYSIRAKWWKTAYGINTWIVSFIIAVALARLSVLVILPGFLSHGVSDGIGIFTYIILAISGVQRLYLMEKAQREGQTKEEPAQSLHEKAMEHSK